MPIFVDTDPGVDDFFALVYLIKCCKDKIVGISSVAGNVNMEKTTKNVKLFASYAKDYLGYSIPIYRGLMKPIFQTEYYDAADFHSEDGLGEFWSSQLYLENQKDVDCRVESVVEEQLPAALGLIELANRYAGELDVIALGPLSNLAVAGMLDPDLGKKIRRLYIMGGSLYGQGNVCPCPTAEFNFFIDPEASYLILRDFDCSKLVLPVEPCWDHTLLPEQILEYQKELLLETQGPSYPKMLKLILAHLLGYRVKYNKPVNIYDMLLVIALLNKEIVTKTTTYKSSVETRGHFSRGMLLLDKKNVYNKDTFNGFRDTDYIMEMNKDWVQKEIKKIL